MGSHKGKKLKDHERVRCYHNLRDKDKVVDLLKEYSEIKIVYKKGESASVVRAKFNGGKRFKKLWGRACFVCGDKGLMHRHHIIQLQHGGKNDKRNVIPICPQCHSKIHHWM
jgi:5-methylcytosine-specific restriction endonuclease McrA